VQPPANPYPALRPKRPWYGRWWAITLWVFLGLALIGTFLPDEEPTGATATDTSLSATAEPEDESSESPAKDDEADSASEETESSEPERANDRETQKSEPKPTQKQARSPKPRPKPSPKANPNTRTAVVARTIDGDTIELSNGQSVRIVGIDTPERGECHFKTASRRMASLVEGKKVTLTRSDEDKDRYGRLLRYVNVGTTDAGLRLIKEGLAVARYDSRDGYGFHPREPRYVAADSTNPHRTCAPAPAPKPGPQQPAGNCESGYHPCVPAHPPDLDCADVNGPIRVTGSDPHGLDRERDGIGCE